MYTYIHTISHIQFRIYIYSYLFISNRYIVEYSTIWCSMHALCLLLSVYHYNAMFSSTLSGSIDIYYKHACYNYIYIYPALTHTHTHTHIHTHTRTHTHTYTHTHTHTHTHIHTHTHTHTHMYTCQFI